MKKLLSHPATNAVCISLFSAFYATMFFITASHLEFKQALAEDIEASYFHSISSFFHDGSHVYIAYALIALTVLVVALLIWRRATYDEYHTTVLANCLVIAMVLTMLAIAVLFVSVVLNPECIIQKFMLFAALHWATVVLSDLVYVLFFRR